MTEKEFTGPENPANPPAPASTSRRKKRRIVLMIIAVLVLGLVLLVLAGPTLLSSGPVLSVIVNQVNKQLNGKLEVSSLSLGWFTGVKADGVRITDSRGAQIAEMDHVVVPYPLWKVIAGRFSLGDILLDGLSFDARVDSNGQLNFAQLIKPGTSTSAPSNAPAAASNAKPSKLPDISANLKLTNCHGTFSQAGKPTVYLTKLDGDIKIPDINQPITDQFTIGMKLDNQKEGTVAVIGSAAVINANQIAMDLANIHQTVTIADLDLQTAKSFIPDSVGVDTLDGTLGAHISADITNGKDAVIDAAITATRPIAFGGKVLQGDTFKTSTLETEVPKLSAVFPDGLAKWQTGRIKVGADAGSAPILLKIDQGQVTAVADLMPQALLNLIAKQNPGSSGQLVVTSSFDLASIIPQLRHSIPEAEGVIIKSAGLTENLKLVLTPDQAQLFNSADSTPVTGVQTLADGSTKPISIGAIHVSAGATDLGGEGKLPNLHGLSLKIQSPFANGEFQGQSLSDLHGTLNANLQVLAAEVSQFIELGKTNVAGNLNIDISGQGKLTEAPYQASLKASVGLQDFKYSDASGKKITEPSVQLTASADLQGSAQNTLDSARNISVSLKMGDASASAVDVLAEVPEFNLTGGAGGEFKLSHLTVDLAKLQSQLAAVSAGKAGVVINQGVLTVSSAGTFSRRQVSFDQLAINADHLFVARQLASGQQISALAGETVNLNLAASANVTPAVDGKSQDMSFRLKLLALDDSARILDIHKTGDSDFILSKNGDGGIAGNGQLALMVQLGSINQIATILGQNELVVKTTAGDLKTGQLTGTFGIASNGPGKTGLSANLNLDNVVLTTATGSLPAQSATITLKATADQAASVVTIDQAAVQSNLASASVIGAKISLSAKSVLDQLQFAHWQADVPDLKPVMDLADAFSPPAQTAGKQVPPLEFISGAISLNGDLSHDNSTVKIDVSDVSAKNIAFHRGDIKYTAKPIDVKLLVAIQTGDGQQLLDQIRQVQITQLTGNLGIATLSMQAPISISQLSTNPAASGGVQLVGNLTDLTQLMAAMQGEKPDAYPYRGNYTLVENIGTQQNTISLKGGIQIAKFQSYSGSTTTFSEDLVNIGNDLALIAQGDDRSVQINSFTAAMQSSGAANISLKNGSLAHLQSTRDMLLQLNVNYDLAKLWPIVQPMMGDKYKTLKIAGQFQKQFNLSGRYPANLPSTEAIKTLHADGDVAVASFDYDGLNLQNFIVPFTLSNGQLVTIYANKPAGQNTAAPAVANGGTLDLSNLTVDLTQDPPRLTTLPNKVLITHATINPLFAGTLLANVINNPLFAGAKSASGLIDLRIDRCSNLPLGDLVMQQSAANIGKIDMHFSMTNLNIGLAADVLQDILKQQSIEADVKDASVAVAGGIATEHINFSTGEYVLSFDGSVRLRDQAYVPMTLGFPLAAIGRKTHLANADYLPDQIKVPMEGTVTNTRYRFDKALPKAIRDAAAKALANGVLGGNKNNNNGQADPLGGLLKGLQKKQN